MRLNLLLLYDSSQTYTNAVWEHLASFSKYSRDRMFYFHTDPTSSTLPDLSLFDGVVIHYTIRLAFDRLPASVGDTLRRFSGLKIVFVQDEYDLTETTRSWIERLGVHLVFTCIPAAYVSRIYSPQRFRNTRFVPNLTGYVSADISDSTDLSPTVSRPIAIGYRGRVLPFWYGTLAQEKTWIAERMKRECIDRKLSADIQWNEQSRIYGPAWYRFLSTCRATLGTESGSNVFDEDGSIRRAIQQELKNHPKAEYWDIHRRFLAGHERDGVMNQISPRLFEAIALRTALVLFEGRYSDILQPDVHFIPLRKDFSNIDDVFAKVLDDDYVSQLTDVAYRDIIAPGRYSYDNFVEQFDGHVQDTWKVIEHVRSTATTHVIRWTAGGGAPAFVTGEPIRAPLASTTLPVWQGSLAGFVLSGLMRLAIPVWRRMPENARAALKPYALALLRRVRQ